MTAVLEPTTTAAPPLYTQQFFLALRKVSRGRIGATAIDGALHQHGEELPAGIFAALHSLHRDGFIALAAPTENDPGWYPAVLSLRGIQLLSAWSMHRPVNKIIKPGLAKNYR